LFDPDLDQNVDILGEHPGEDVADFLFPLSPGELP
jgi:hypothetical protein